jgi:hypothetical protein
LSRVTLSPSVGAWVEEELKPEVHRDNRRFGRRPRFDRLTGTRRRKQGEGIWAGRLVGRSFLFIHTRNRLFNSFWLTYGNDFNCESEREREWERERARGVRG